MTDTIDRADVHVSSVRRDLALDAATLALLGAAVVDSMLTLADGPSLRVPVYIAALSLLVPWAVRWEGLPLPWPAVTVVKVVMLLPLLVVLARQTASLEPGLLLDPFRDLGSDHWRVTSAQVALVTAALVLALQPRAGEGGPVSVRAWRWAGIVVLAVGAALGPLVDLVRLSGDRPLETSFWLAGAVSLGLLVTLLGVLVAQRRPGADQLLLTCGTLAWLLLMGHGWWAVRSADAASSMLVADSSVALPPPVPGASAAVGLVAAAGCLVASRRSRTRTDDSAPSGAVVPIAVLLASATGMLLASLLMAGSVGGWSRSPWLLTAVAALGGVPVAALLVALRLARNTQPRRRTARVAAALASAPLLMTVVQFLDGPGALGSTLLGQPFDGAVLLGATGLALLPLLRRPRVQPHGTGEDAPTRG